eukprot:CAMPEP_0179205448 /NCGR_PEP_ID=MMETSP0796-20121207/102425_1 /TAXON_ID=73915 /ORGANISM="Pyrodinium bahamense, Strain pbaha01" /LENGTH=42 /DNA_ID= /DNA_START= /DNA_END= /DNA_ORIENTATION=
MKAMAPAPPPQPCPTELNTEAAPQGLQQLCEEAPAALESATP